jgi:integrase
MSVYDRWHKARPGPGEPLCQHRKVASAEHDCEDQWQVRWRDESGSQRKRNFAKKAAAASFDAEVRSRLDKGTSLDQAAGKMTVTEWAARWRADLTIADSTAERLDRVFRLHVDAVPLGGMKMAAVRPSHMRAWVKDRSEVLAGSTLAVVWANVASMFGAAVLDRVIGVSPCTGLSAPGAEPPPHFIPATDQVHAVAAALPDRYRAVAWLAAGCGWRRGEILGVELPSADFLRRSAEVSQQLKSLTGVPPFIGLPKTRTSARVSEMPEVTQLALARHLERFPVTPRPIWDRTDRRRHVQRPASLVFTTSTGGPVHPAFWSDIWRVAADKAGIPKGVGVHCLRHYYATLLIHQGKSVKYVQVAMGHATPMITLNTYAGLWPDEEEGGARSIVDAALRNVTAQCHDLGTGS